MSVDLREEERPLTESTTNSDNNGRFRHNSSRRNASRDQMEETSDSAVNVELRKHPSRGEHCAYSSQLDDCLQFIVLGDDSGHPTSHRPFNRDSSSSESDSVHHKNLM